MLSVIVAYPFVDYRTLPVVLHRQSLVVQLRQGLLAVPFTNRPKRKAMSKDQNWLLITR